MKNKKVSNWVIVIAAVTVIIFWGVSAYNNLVSQEESVESAWSQVENVYQRRADLIPNLVNTVKGYASHEQETLTSVIEARSKATQITIDPAKLDAKALAQYQSAQNELSAALGRLMVLKEQYPNLKADQSFINLQTQLEGTENRITVERQKFNETAKSYNTSVRKFPKSIIAGIFGFEKKGYFEAMIGAENAPKVEF
jgi:LemA protein